MTSYRQPFEQNPGVQTLQHHTPPPSEETTMPFSVRKRSRATARQLEEMVELMLQNKDLAVGRFSGPMGQEANERMWEEVAAKLIAFGPPKTSTQCKTSWRDLKLKVKAKNANIKKCRMATGNVTKVPELTDLEKKVLQIIGTESSEGIGVEESGLEGQRNVAVPPAPAAAAAAYSSMYVQLDEYEMDTITEPTHFIDEVEARPPLPATTPIQQRPHTTPQRQTAANGPTGSRKRPFLAVDDVAKQYAELQAKTNEFLAPTHFINEVEARPPLPATTPIQQRPHTTPQRQTAANGPTGSRKRPFVEVDDVAKQYAELQANTNKILADIALSVREAVEEKNKNDQIRNNLIKERNQIEREKLRIKSLQLKMMMLNQHVADDSE